MDIVLDTCCVAALTRGTQNSRDDLVTKLVHRKGLRVVVDRGTALIDEWKKTVSPEIVQALVVKWSDDGGLVQVRKDCKMPKDLARELQRLSFTDTCDKLIVRIAIGTTDRTIVSNDSDFWDPKDSTRQGDATAPVAVALDKHENIRIMTLNQLKQNSSL